MEKTGKSSFYYLLTLPFHPTLPLVFSSQNEPQWDTELEQDVRDEAGKFGLVVHAHVDEDSEVSLKCHEG